MVAGNSMLSEAAPYIVDQGSRPANENVRIFGDSVFSDSLGGQATIRYTERTPASSPNRYTRVMVAGQSPSQA
jgi:hypothetical protein